MKNRLISFLGLSTLLAVATHVWAQEQGRVISSTPVIQQVAVPRQVCTNEQITSSAQQKSGAGALIGGIAGGAMGNAVGNGNGRAAATMIGIFGGAILGDRIEGGQPQSNTQNVQRCTTQTFYENKTVAYNVVYEFNGKQYQVQMPQDPGPTVNLQVTPVGGTTSGSVVSQAAPTTYAAPVQQVQSGVIESSTVFVAQAPAYVHPVFAHPVYNQPVYSRPAPIYVRPAPVVIYRHYAPRPYYQQHVRPYHGGSGAAINIQHHGKYR